MHWKFRLHWLCQMLQIINHLLQTSPNGPLWQFRCFNFSVNPLRFYLTRKTDINWQEPKAEQSTKLQFLNRPKHQFCQMAIFFINLQIVQNSSVVGSSYFCVSFSHERRILEHWEKIWNTKSEPLAIWAFLLNRSHIGNWFNNCNCKDISSSSSDVEDVSIES